MAELTERQVGAIEAAASDALPHVYRLHEGGANTILISSKTASASDLIDYLETATPAGVRALCRDWRSQRSEARLRKLIGRLAIDNPMVDDDEDNTRRCFWYEGYHDFVTGNDNHADRCPWVEARAALAEPSAE